MSRFKTADVVARQYQAGQQLAARWAYERGLPAAIFRHRQAVESWGKANHPGIPWQARALLLGESDTLLLLASA